MQQRLPAGGIVLLPVLPVVALFVYWAAHQGGYLPTTWLPSALLVLGLLVAIAIGIGLDRIRLSKPAAIALAALAAFTAWSYLSILWAAAPGDALDGSNRTLLFLLLFAFFAVLPWRPWAAIAALSAFALGVGAIAVVVLVQMGSAERVLELFIEYRLSEPIGYVNGTPALFTIAAIVATALATRRELPALLRAALLAVATAGLQVSVLSESRGWLFALPFVAIAVLLLMPNRVRFALWSALPLVGALLALPALLDVYELPSAAPGVPGAGDRALVAAAEHAASVALPLCAGVFVVGLALALLDRRIGVPPRVVAGANRAAAALAALAVVGAVAAAFVATDGRPDREIADYWERSSGYKAAEAGTSRFSTVGSNRPDFWKVALDAVGERPLQGLGQDNWAGYYLRHRESTEQPRWVHSLQLRLLAHTGIVGLALFATFVVSALVAALSGGRTRRANVLARAVAAVAVIPLVVWFVHGTVDWFWEIPALSGPAFAFLGLATAVMRSSVADGAQPPTPPPSQDAGRRRAARAATGIAAIGAGVVLAAVLAFPFLAERSVSDAGADWQADPTAALRDLGRAADLNPLSARADLTAGVIALELGHPGIALQRFDRAIERDPDDWFAHFGHGLAESAEGERAAARADYERARELSPDEPLVADALRRVDRRRPLEAAEAFASLRQRVRILTGQR